MSNKSILQSNNETLSSNNLNLQNLIDQANALPDAGDIELPELLNPATSAEIFANKELIDADGNKIIGTFTIDNELATQNNLITQIQSAVDNLSETSVGIEWISCSTLPTSHVIEPGATAYYIELPSENCFVLFYNPECIAPECRMGCYDVYKDAQTVGCHMIFGGGTASNVVSDSTGLYLEMSSENLSTTAYYAIIPSPSL